MKQDVTLFRRHVCWLWRQQLVVVKVWSCWPTSKRILIYALDFINCQGRYLGLECWPFLFLWISTLDNLFLGWWLLNSVFNFRIIFFTNVFFRRVFFSILIFGSCGFLFIRKGFLLLDLTLEFIVNSLFDWRTDTLICLTFLIEPIMDWICDRLNSFLLNTILLLSFLSPPTHARVYLIQFPPSLHIQGISTYSYHAHWLACTYIS